MSFGGIGVMRRLVSRLGLVREIDRRLHLLKRHLPYRESDHVLNIAYRILCGGTRLEAVWRGGASRWGHQGATGPPECG